MYKIYSVAKCRCLKCQGEHLVEVEFVRSFFLTDKYAWLKEYIQKSNCV